MTMSFITLDISQHDVILYILQTSSYEKGLNSSTYHFINKRQSYAMKKSHHYGVGIVVLISMCVFLVFWTVHTLLVPSSQNGLIFDGFMDGSSAQTALAPPVLASPALANLLILGTPQSFKTPVQVDILQRGADEQQVQHTDAPHPPQSQSQPPHPQPPHPQPPHPQPPHPQPQPPQPPHPACPPGPDMSKYIRIDEIPCWNCNVEETIHY